ncbi:unnamed protein product [Taenia asiatica]|uniref:Ovule protein n=1 Tax=Taenia asiatica TaxID=60517 RepID=A0A0R3WHD4_TAEAS|nr:unnamed protein product [Taenia asiatica]
MVCFIRDSGFKWSKTRVAVAEMRVKQKMKKEVMALEQILNVVIQSMMTGTVRNVRMEKAKWKKKKKKKKETCTMMEK